MSYLTDNATDTDQLEFDDFRKALADILTTADTPLTVGIFGNWGSGKTSLMKMLRKDIEDLGLPSRRTVWFTAWKYDQQDALWRSLILRVLNALYPREPGDGPREERPMMQNPGEREEKLIQLLNRMEESVYQSVTWEEIGPRAINWWQFLGGISKASVKTAAALGTAGLSQGVVKLIGDENSPIDDLKSAAEAISREARQYHRRQLAHMEEFEKMFGDAVGLIDGDENRRLVVFVDDLDRCLPEKAIEVLEAIKLFLEAKGVVFVLGMDKEVVQRGIEARYGAHFHRSPGALGELPISGDSYLQKMVQIPFYLPSLAVSDLETFIGELGQKLDERTAQVIARGVYPNPRQIKRVINIFQLLRTIADQRFGTESDEISNPLLAKTVILQTQYPDLYHLWRQYPAVVQVLEEAYDRDRVSDEELLLAGHRRRVGTEGDAEDAAHPAAPRQAEGLLAQYLNNRADYARLAGMLTYPSSTEAGEGREQARFSGLTRSQLATYVRLAGTVESKPSEPSIVPVPADLLAELLSGDEVRLRNAAGLLESEGPDSSTRRALREHMKQMLVVSTTTPVERALAGDALVELGDDRSGVLTCDDMPLCYVPPGDFWMTDEPKSKKGRLIDILDRPYWMAQYPVTVAQFREFVRDSDNNYKPVTGDRPLSSPDNRPVVYVNWYDALAFCEWLNKRWQDHLPSGYRVTLPNEAEWEKAARGGLVVPVAPHVMTFHSLKETLATPPATMPNELPRREYPWGDEPEKPGTTGDVYRANNQAAGVGRATAVGSFPAGGSRSGCLDMSGNVWEWTRSYYDKKRPYRLSADYETVRRDNKESMLLCGGAYYRDYTGCSARSWSYPHLFPGLYGFRVAVSPFVSDR